MMNDQQMTLEDILDAYVSANPTPSKQHLSEWIRRYPQYRRQLIEFTVSWLKMEMLPSPAHDSEVSEEDLVQRGMAVVRSLLIGSNGDNET